jgi:hypothetical protein
MTATRSGFSASFLALVTTAALLGGGVVAVDTAAATQHSTVFAKHCKAKCRQAKATHYLAGHRYFYFAGSPGIAGTALNLDLCPDGTLRASGDTLEYRLGAYDFSFDGTWTVMSARGWRARVAFTTVNYQTNKPPAFGQPNPPPEAGVLRLWIKARSAVGIRDGGGLFDPTQGTLSRTASPSGSCSVVGAPSGA